MKSEILRMLKERDSYVSGQELCEHFHVSRTAVWKVIKQLEAEGYQIKAVRNKGYHLTKAGDLLSKAELESCMNTRWAGKNILYYDEIDSTNTMAKMAAEEGAPHGSLIVADYQSMGKGRRGRGWSAPHGAGLWMSIVLRPNLHPMTASMLTLVAAMAVTDGIRKVSEIEAGIKWPNDIVCGGRKLCGILTEMSTELECINYVVTGIGINVNIESFPEGIKDVATSINLENGRKNVRSHLAGAVMEAFEGYYETFEKIQNLSTLKELYNRQLVNKGKQVRVLAVDGDYEGTSLGINDAGELLVQTEDGEIRQVISGEVSVRGIYGYV